MAYECYSSPIKQFLSSRLPLVIVINSVGAFGVRDIVSGRLTSQISSA